MVIGIAYHSPLDVAAVIPTGITATTDPCDETAQVLFSSKLEKTNIACQLVFASYRVLQKSDISVIDHGPNGTVLTLSKLDLDSIFGAG